MNIRHLKQHFYHQREKSLNIQYPYALLFQSMDANQANVHTIQKFLAERQASLFFYKQSLLQTTPRFFYGHNQGALVWVNSHEFSPSLLVFLRRKKFVFIGLHNHVRWWTAAQLHRLQPHMSVRLPLVKPLFVLHNHLTWIASTNSVRLV